MSATMPLRLDSAEGDPLKRRGFALRHAKRILMVVEGAECLIGRLLVNEPSRKDMLEVMGLIAEEADFVAFQLEAADAEERGPQGQAPVVDLRPVRLADFEAGSAGLYAVAHRYAARILLLAEGAEASLEEFDGVALLHQDMLDVLGMIGEEAESLVALMRNAEFRRVRSQGVPA